GIDTHFHMASPRNFGKLQAIMGPSRLPQPITSSDALALLDDAGLATAVVLSMAYMLDQQDDAQAENDFVAAAAADAPGRIYGLCGIKFQAVWAFDEVRRCLAKPGMKGVKLHLMFNEVDMKLLENRQRFDAILDAVAAIRPGAFITVDHYWMDDVAT